MSTQVGIPTTEQLAQYQQQFCQALRETKREGIEALLHYLETETDFFVAPASTTNHGAFPGGLLLHSVTVYKYLQNFLKPFMGDIVPESIAIAGLLHDICKTNFYVKRVKNVKDLVTKKWMEQEVYVIEDSFPMGHGEKSVFLASKFISLTDDEALAIRWHMGGFDDAARQYASAKALSAAFERSKLAAATSIADMYVAQLIGC